MRVHAWLLNRPGKSIFPGGFFPGRFPCQDIFSRVDYPGPILCSVVFPGWFPCQGIFPGRFSSSNQGPIFPRPTFLLQGRFSLVVFFHMVDFFQDRFFSWVDFFPGRFFFQVDLKTMGAWKKNNHHASEFCRVFLKKGTNKKIAAYISSASNKEGMDLITLQFRDVFPITIHVAQTHQIEIECNSPRI